MCLLLGLLLLLLLRRLVGLLAVLPVLLLQFRVQFLLPCPCLLSLAVLLQGRTTEVLKPPDCTQQLPMPSCAVLVHLLLQAGLQHPQFCSCDAAAGVEVQVQGTCCEITVKMQAASDVQRPPGSPPQWIRGLQHQAEFLSILLPLLLLSTSFLGYQSEGPAIPSLDSLQVLLRQKAWNLLLLLLLQ